MLSNHTPLIVIITGVAAKAGSVHLMCSIDWKLGWVGSKGQDTLHSQQISYFSRTPILNEMLNDQRKSTNINIASITSKGTQRCHNHSMTLCTQWCTLLRIIYLDRETPSLHNYQPFTPYIPNSSSGSY